MSNLISNEATIARFLTLLMILPLIAGLTVKASSTSIAPRLRPVLEQVSTITLLAAFILIFALNFQGMLRIFGTGAIFGVDSN